MVAVRAAIGNDVTLMVDANSGSTSEEHAGPVADMLARSVQRRNVTAYEQSHQTKRQFQRVQQRPIYLSLVLVSFSCMFLGVLYLGVAH